MTSMKMKESPDDKYNKKRKRLCEYSVSEDEALRSEPALKRLAKIYGSKVKAITEALVAHDKQVRRRKK